MSSDNTPRRYTPDEVNEILRRALDRQGGSSTGALTHEDLIETARELGLDPAQVEAAIIEQEREGPIEAARATWKVERKRKFFEHLRSYLVVNVILFLINFATGEEVWFVWPLFGWGIGLLFDASDAFFPKEKDIERGARRLVERQNRQRARDVKVQNGSRKSLIIDGKAGKIIIERGDKRIEIG
jgi:hypothetical protein